MRASVSNAHGPIAAHVVRMVPGDNDDEFGEEIPVMGLELLELVAGLVDPSVALGRRLREGEIKRAVCAYMRGFTNPICRGLKKAIKQLWVDGTGRAHPTLAEVLQWEERVR
jgi:hypothetical protein